MRRKKTRFLEAKAMMGSKVEHVVADITYLTPRDIGYFDIVLFFGVLYHLKHPMLALEGSANCPRIWPASSLSSPTNNRPAPSRRWSFTKARELAGQFDNWVGPNISCLLAMCRTAGFARVEFQERARSPRPRALPSQMAGDRRARLRRPELMVVENSELQDHSFSARRDDYITVWCQHGRAESDL